MSTFNAGNPPCTKYTWHKREADDLTFPRIIERDNTLRFVMESKHDGTYHCCCGNEKGKTDQSQGARISFVNSSTASRFFFPCTINVLRPLLFKKKYNGCIKNKMCHLDLLRNYLLGAIHPGGSRGC